jgi:hypothetical protein
MYIYIYIYVKRISNEVLMHSCADTYTLFGQLILIEINY